MRVGVEHLWRTPTLRWVTIASSLEMAAYGATPVAYPLLAEEVGSSAAAGGLLFSTGALGALVGSLLTVARGSRRDPASTVALGLSGLALLFAGLAAAPSLAWAAGITVLAGLCGGPVLAATLTARAIHSPEHLRTQIIVTAASLKGGGFAVGSVVAGVVAGAHGPRTALAVSAGTLLVAASTLLLVLRPLANASAPDVVRAG